MQTGRLKVRWSWLASLLRHYLQAWATMGRLTSAAGKPGRRPDRAVPLPATKAQSNPEVEVSAELSEASNSGSRARRETFVTRHSSLHSGSTEISHSPLFFVVYILGPRQSSRCSERVEQAQDSGPSADKCDRVGICSPKCLATKPKTEAASSPKVPDSWRRVRSSGKQPHGLIHVSRAL